MFQWKFPTSTELTPFKFSDILLTVAYCFTCIYFICGIPAEVLISEVPAQVYFLNRNYALENDAQVSLD